MGIRDVPIPERIGDKIPCDRCRNMHVPDSLHSFCESYRSGYISDNEMRSVLEDAAKDSRLHEECAIPLIENVICHYRPKRKK